MSGYSELECIPSNQGLKVPLWQPKAVTWMTKLRDSCGGKLRHSLYLEMRNRRGGGLPVRGTDCVALCVREPWAVVTVRFGAVSSMVDKIKTLPERLSGTMFCWVFAGREPDHLWSDGPSVSTCVFVVGGIPASFSVKRLMFTLIGVVEPDPSFEVRGPYSDWWVSPLEDEAEFEYWYGCHEMLLARAHSVVEVYPMQSVGDSLEALTCEATSGEEDFSILYDRSISPWGEICDEGRRTPLKEMVVNEVN